MTNTLLIATGSSPSILSIPYQYPVGAIPASLTSQMFYMVSAANSYDFTSNIGEISDNQVYETTIQNVTFNANLSIIVQFPNFLNCSPAGSIINNFFISSSLVTSTKYQYILPANNNQLNSLNSILQLTFSYVESYGLNQAIAGNYFTSDNIQYFITPILLSTDPVLISQIPFGGDTGLVGDANP